MTDGNYERIIEKIARLAGVGKEEVERKVEEKKSKLSGFISKEGAAQIVASELGISFENEKLKINELLPGMRRVNVIGKVFNIFPVRTFKTKKGEESKVVNFWLADDSSNIRVVLWDTNHVGLIEKGEIREGSVVAISNASMRDNELHLGNFSEIKISPEILEKVVTEKVLKEKNLSDFKKGENVSVRAFIVQMFEPRFFYVCPECGKKINREGEFSVCELHEKVVPEKRAVATLVLDDGTNSIRAVLFQEALKELGFTDIENTEKLSVQKENILGKEMVFSGNVRQNVFFDNLELIVDGAKEVDVDKVIKTLEEN
jgi:ssDNA-binding replication factor A large subunit